MKRLAKGAFWSFTACMTALTLCGADLSAENNSPKVIVHRASSVGVSPPLRELAKLPPPRLYRLRISPPRLHSMRRPADTVVDATEQNIAGSGQNFSIVENSTGMAPGFTDFSTTFNYPDDNIAVGGNSPAQIVQVVNNSVAVFDKSLNPLTPAASIPELLTEFPGNCATGTPIGHAIVQYARAAGQWFIAENVVSGSSGSFTSDACIAVSQTSDATGSYYVYDFPLGAGYMDLPKWGIMTDGVFQSNDNFGDDAMTFQGAYECAYDGTALGNGGPATQECFQLSSSDFALLPADLDSAQPSPDGQDEFLFSLWDNAHLALYSFHTDFVDPSNAFITGADGSQLFNVGTYTPACNGQYLAACVPQPSPPPTPMLDVLGDRLLYRVAYYDDPAKVPATALPPRFQHWLVMHDVTASGGNTAERWYEFYSSTKTQQVTNIDLLQSGVYAPDSNNYRWMGSIARDQNGDILMGYSESSTTQFPSVYITGRTPSDPNGTMEVELPVFNGTGAYLANFDHNLNRWGDYTSMRLDPADNCTFWYTNEYYTISGVSNWWTRINSACFAGCGSCGGNK
jgi:hypothetical protein